MVATGEVNSNFHSGSFSLDGKSKTLTLQTSVWLTQTDNPRPQNAPFLVSSDCHCLSLI